MINIGDRVIDKFEVISHLGVGGCGNVLKAKDCILLENVAIKVLNEEYANNDMVKNMFLNEAKICLKLIHKNIIRVREVNIHNSIYFMVMDYIDGMNLSQYLKINTFEPKDFYFLMRDVLLALDYAHQFTVHRDIKPANIMVCKNDNRLVLMDFGISKALEDSEIKNNTLIDTLGTRSFMSPEQALSAKDIDKRTDIYAMGVIFYHTLTHTAPPKSEEIIPPHKLNNKISIQMSDIILKMLAYKKENRYQNIIDLVQDMDKIFDTNTNQQNPKQTQILNQTLENFVFVESGNFFRGSGSESSIEIEKPRKIIYQDSFFISKYPVTNKEYYEYIKEANIEVEFDIEQLAQLYPNHPIVNVSWSDAIAYAYFYGYDLPTESQWEKSAKGKSDYMYPWGNIFDITKANIGKPTGEVVSVFEYENSKSEYGCVQMAGNVWEWCKDSFEENFYKIDNSLNPINNKEINKKVLRGGSYDFIPFSTRCAYRYSQEKDVKKKNIGFRVVKNMEEKTNV